MTDYKMPIRKQESNKGTFGKVLNLSGCENYLGAAYLSTVSTLKVGAGFCALASTKDVIRSVSALLPEAVYLSRSEALRNIKQYTTFLIGCGLGQERASIKVFKQFINKLQKETMPVVIDADGLNILSRTKIKLPKNSVITPHPLEAARLLGVEVDKILSDLEGSAKKLSAKYECVAILKTHRTIICEGEKVFVNQHGNSALAKAGSGDVLAGIIAGLLAQGMPTFEATKLGVYLHSRAGEIASEKLSEYSVLASDLPKYVSFAIKELITQN